MASTQLETLRRSLELPGMRRFKEVTFALLFVVAAIVIIAVAAHPRGEAGRRKPTSVTRCQARHEDARNP